METTYREWEKRRQERGRRSPRRNNGPALGPREARRLGVIFNRSDNPADCDFFFPAVCEGAGMVAGLAGDGGDHGRTARTAREIRKILESSKDET